MKKTISENVQLLVYFGIQIVRDDSKSSLFQVEYFSVGSPVTNHHYIAAPRGEIYGLDHDLKRFDPNVLATLRPDVPEIPQLYLSGIL